MKIQVLFFKSRKILDIFTSDWETGKKVKKSAGEDGISNETPQCKSTINDQIIAIGFDKFKIEKTYSNCLKTANVIPSLNYKNLNSCKIVIRILVRSGKKIIYRT